MVKKSTKAIFEDGGYRGEYDWEGGIPLSENELISINCDDVILKYILVHKETLLSEKEGNQQVEITYRFKLTV